MKLVIKWIYLSVKNFMDRMRRDHVGAYAAQAAYFIMLSFIPIIMLMLGLLQYTPVRQSDLQRIFYESVPQPVYPMILLVLEEVYARSSALIPTTAIVAAWSAGRGMLALTRGFNCIYEVNETRSYVILRLRSTMYTILFILSVVLTLLLLVFGNPIHALILDRFPWLSHISGMLISFRTLLTLGILVLFFTLIYRFLPNRRASLILQLPGAMFTAAAWSASSFLFSVYVDYFGNYSKIYGSLTTLILMMLWLYMCMYIVMLGAAVNSYYEEKFREFREKARRKRFVRRHGEGREGMQ